MRRFDGGDGTFEMLATQKPDRWNAQRLRGLAHPDMKLGGYAHEHLPGLVETGVLAGEGDRGLARMGGGIDAGRGW